MNCDRRSAALSAGLVLSCLAFGVSVAGESTKGGKLPGEDKKALEQALDRVFDKLPAPRQTFRRDREADDRTIDGQAPPRTEAGAWRRPAGARATRSYVRRGRDGDDLYLEVTVYLNSESSLSDPLSSAGGSIRIDLRDEAPFARHALAGIDDVRLALPVDAEQRANALTVVRAFIAAPEAGPYLTDLAQGRNPRETPWDGITPGRPSVLRTIVVEYHGPAEEVDRLAEATPVSEIRRLLAP
jgi:hypothetical protein